MSIMRNSLEELDEISLSQYISAESINFYRNILQHVTSNRLGKEPYLSAQHRPSLNTLGSFISSALVLTSPGVFLTHISDVKRNHPIVLAMWKPSE